MAAAPKENLGKMPCPCCSQPVALKKSATGKLSYQCQEADCEAIGYAEPHSSVARKWIAAVGTRQQPPKAPAEPNPVPPPAKGGFSLGGL